MNLVHFTDDLPILVGPRNLGSTTPFFRPMGHPYYWSNSTDIRLAGPLIPLRRSKQLPAKGLEGKDLDRVAVLPISNEGETPDIVVRASF